MSEILITVVMPAFNAGRFIHEAIESVLAQEFDRYELIVVDDGSSDSTTEKIATFASHARVRVFENVENLGSGKTRNQIIDRAQGKYLLPCDADDLLLPGAMQHLSEYLDKHPKVGVVYGDILRLDTDSGTLLRLPSVIGRDPGEVWDLHENVVNHGGSLLRTNLARQVGGYATGHVPDDWGLFLKLAEITRIHYLGGRIYYIWRTHEGSQSRKVSNRRDMDVLIQETARRRETSADNARKVRAAHKTRP